GLGGGQSSMKVGDKTAWTVDLNKDAWRHLDLKLSRDDQGRVVVSMNPELDFILGTFYSVLRQMGSAYPDTMADESLRLRISGGGTPSMTAVAADATTGFPGGWKMLSGGLTFSTDQAGFDPLVVRAGQCMVPRQSPPAAGMHPVYGAWEAVDCP